MDVHGLEQQVCQDAVGDIDGRAVLSSAVHNVEAGEGRVHVLTAVAREVHEVEHGPQDHFDFKLVEPLTKPPYQQVQAWVRGDPLAVAPIGCHTLDEVLDKNLICQGSG